jgi:methionyl-tRNA formyltransferase
MKLLVVFFGTSAFAVPALVALARDARFEVIGVVTQPDRPAGRKGEITKPAMKLTAETLGLPVFQFESVKDDASFDELKKIGGDVAVVASFGQIIPQRLLDVYPHGAVNIHGSILPEYRGASPIAAAIRDGKTETGVTIMLMDAKMDHGPILSIAKEPILPDDTSESLTVRMAMLGATVLPDVLAKYVAGEIKPIEQDHSKATGVKLLTREDGRLDLNRPAVELERLVRAMTPWPGTFFEQDGKRVKVLKARVEGDAFIPIEVHPEGKKPMSYEDYQRGRRD